MQSMRHQPDSVFKARSAWKAINGEKTLAQQAGDLGFINFLCPLD